MILLLSAKQAGIAKGSQKKNTQNDFSVATYSRRRFHVFASQIFDRVLLIYAKNFIKYPFYRMLFWLVTQ